MGFAVKCSILCGNKCEQKLGKYIAEMLEICWYSWNVFFIKYMGVDKGK